MVRVVIWPLHDIAILPILYGVWHTKEGSGGVVCCAIVTVVRSYCNRVGLAGGVGVGQKMMIDSNKKALSSAETNIL